MADFSLMQITKVIAHVLLAPAGSENAQAVCSDAMIHLDTDGLRVLNERASNVLGRNSNAINMDIDAEIDPGCFPRVQELLDDDSDDVFIQTSARIARQHATIHTNKAWPMGLLIVMKASAGTASKNMVIILKAEKLGGFKQTQVDGYVNLEYVKVHHTTKTGQIEIRM